MHKFLHQVILPRKHTISIEGLNMKSFKTLIATLIVAACPAAFATTDAEIALNVARGEGLLQALVESCKFDMKKSSEQNKMVAFYQERQNGSGAASRINIKREVVLVKVQYLESFGDLKKSVHDSMCKDVKKDIKAVIDIQVAPTTNGDFSKAIKLAKDEVDAMGRITSRVAKALS